MKHWQHRYRGREIQRRVRTRTGAGRWAPVGRPAEDRLSPDASQVDEIARKDRNLKTPLKVSLPFCCSRVLQGVFMAKALAVYEVWANLMLWKEVDR